MRRTRLTCESHMLTSLKPIAERPSTTTVSDSGLPTSERTLFFLLLTHCAFASHLCLWPLVQITMICQSLELCELPMARSYLQFMLSMCFHRISSAASASRRKVIKILSFFGKLVEINFPMEPYLIKINKIGLGMRSYCLGSEVADR